MSTPFSSECRHRTGRTTRLMERAALLATLGRTALFRGVPQRELEELAVLLKPRTFARGGGPLVCGGGARRSVPPLGGGWGGCGGKQRRGWGLQPICVSCVESS